MGSNSEPTLINSVRRALRILEAVSECTSPPTALQLSSMTGLPQSTVYHLLRTLVLEGYLTWTSEHTYALSDRMAQLSERGRTGARKAQLEAIMADLRDSVNRAVYLALFDGAEVRLSSVSENHRARAIEQWIAFDEVPHATALGKATMHVMGPSLRKQFLASHQLQRLTPTTITAPRRLLEDNPVDANGLVIDREEYAPGVACVAYPIATDHLIGAVAIDLSPRRLGDLGRIAARLASTAQRLSRVLVLG